MYYRIQLGFRKKSAKNKASGLPVEKLGNARRNPFLKVERRDVVAQSPKTTG
jgi:hypothetical protein